MGIDGCGVPVQQVPLANLAWGFARMAKPESIDRPALQAAVRRVTDAMIAAPEMVGGKSRYYTDLMRAFGGRIFGKAGAESVYCLGDRETGLGIAVKFEDGGARAIYAVVNEVLHQLNTGVGGVLETLSEYTQPAILNMSGKVVGDIRTHFELQPSRRA
jgi:L-asparaginase II